MKWKALLVFSLFVATAVAQTGRQPIWLESQTPDDVSKSFVYQLREEIARSALYRLADSRKNAFLELSIVGVSLSGEQANNSGSAVSIVLFWLDSKQQRNFMEQFVLVVGAQKTLECAWCLMVSVDETVRAWTKEARSAVN